MDNERVTLNSDDLHYLSDLEKVVNVTANYVVGRTEDILLVDTVAGAVSITLPKANRGRRITILRKMGTNNVTINPDPGQLINGAVSVTISTSFSPLRLKAITGYGFVGV